MAPTNLEPGCCVFLMQELQREREARDRRVEAVERAGVAVVDVFTPITPALPHPRARRLPRGVYLSPFLSRTGNDVWFAVDSRHRCRKSLEVTDARPEWLCRRVLAGLLDQIDPVPQLRAI